MRQTSDTLDMDGISPGLAYILSKMLALRIEMRYQSAQEVLNAIDAYQKGKMTVMTDTYPNDAGVTTVGTNGGTTGGTTGGMTGGSANGTTNSDTKKILIPLLIVLAAVLGISVVLAILLTL